MRRLQSGLPAPRLRVAQAGTSVLAALVFVAIFVLFISGYKLASQTPGTQSAAVAGALKHKTATCTGAEVYTVNMVTGSGVVDSVNCSDSAQSERPECSSAPEGACAVRYCPPASFVTDSGTCFVMSTCNPASDPSCLTSAIQNASQPMQAASIIAARLLADRGETNARAPGYSGPIALADKLTDHGRSAVGLVIEETAEAASAHDLDADEIRDIGEKLGEAAEARPTSGPLAQISCQPKIAESGMKIGIAFGCANSTASIGGGFDTGARLWGATTEELPDDLPNGTMTYSLTCTDRRQAALATCSVAVMKPFMLLTGKVSDTVASIAWVTRGMDVCDISIPGNAELSAAIENPVPQSGALTLPSASSDTEVLFTCTTVGGVVKQLTTTLGSTR